MKLNTIIATIAMVALLAACNHPSVPEQAQKENRLPHIYPDYTEVTIPCNICPLNFAVQEGTKEVVARLTYPGGEVTYGADGKILIDEVEWDDILQVAKGKSIEVEVFAKVVPYFP